jgi:hypothetical protein
MAQNKPTVMYSPYGQSLNGQDPKNLAMPNAKPTTTKVSNNLGDSFLGPQQTGNTNVFSVGEGQGMFPAAKPTYSATGTGGMRQNNLAGMPSMAQWQAGLMHDLNLQNDLNQSNYKANQSATDKFLNLGQQGLSNFQDPNKSGQAFFDQAQGFRNQGYKEAGIAADKLNTQLDSAARQQDQGNLQALSMYDQAIAKSAQGTDKIASAMSAAAARKTESEKDAISNEFSGALPGTDAQTADLYRSKERDLNEAVFGSVSQIQNQANQTQSQLLAGKGGLAAQLSGTSANFKAMAAQAGFGAAQNQNEFNKLGSQIAMGNAAFQFQNNEAFMGAAMNIGKGYADMIKSNPIMGVAVMPTLMAMGEVSKQYGFNSDLMMHPDNRSFTRGSGISDYGGLQNKLMQDKNRQYAQQQGANYV